MATSKVWAIAEKKECPSLTALPAPICDIMKNEEVEQKVVGFLCSKVKLSECSEIAPKIWEFVAQKECSSMEALPPQFCQVMKNQALEKKLIGMICSKQTEVPAAECEMATSKVWAIAEKKECPSLTALPAPICDIMKNEEVEQKVVGFLCSKVKLSECSEIAPKIWEFVAQKECSSMEIMTELPPQFCELIKNKAAEKKAITLLCSKEKFVPQAECEALTEKM